jgi:hypothetical protein
LKRLKDFSPEARKSGRTYACLVAFLLLLVPGCAGVERLLFEAPYDQQSMAALVKELQDQNKKVDTFFSSGRLWVKGWYGEEGEANIFSAAAKSSFRIKIEVTHPWGQPVMHLLVDGTHFRLLSFSERKLYFGEFTREALSRFFPEEMDQTLIWDLLRAYPVLEPPYRAHSSTPNRIGFTNEEGLEKKVIAFDRESRQPTELILPHQNIKLVFSDFQVSEGFRYARETALVHVLGGKRLVHKVEKMFFNRAIPEQVFSLQAPPGFDTVSLD